MASMSYSGKQIQARRRFRVWCGDGQYYLTPQSLSVTELCDWLQRNHPEWVEKKTIGHLVELAWNSGSTNHSRGQRHDGPWMASISKPARRQQDEDNGEVEIQGRVEYRFRDPTGAWLSPLTTEKMKRYLLAANMSQKNINVILKDACDAAIRDGSWNGDWFLASAGAMSGTSAPVTAKSPAKPGLLTRLWQGLRRRPRHT